MPQVFQTDSKIRWNTFKWVSRFLVFILLLMIPTVWLALALDKKPLLPGLSRTIKETRVIMPKDMSVKDQKKYHGFADFLALKRKNKRLAELEQKKITTNAVRAAFFVDWDPQAFYSLQSHIRELNMILPEWFFIDPITDTLTINIDADALRFMKQYPVKIVPILSNVNLKKHDGDFDGKLLAKAISTSAKREALINAIVSKLKQYQLQGINIDFEELSEKSINNVHEFQKELYAKMHAQSLIVTQDILPDDEDFHLNTLSENNDYLFLMAYDQHYTSSNPGPVADQKWVEKQLDKMAMNIPSEKIVLCIAGYGYDWPEGSTASTLTFSEAMATAKEYNVIIDFDNDSYNCKYEYTDYGKVHHTVYFMDAAGNFNSIRFADEYGAAGVALWRLGSEDERIWKYFGRNLNNETLRHTPFDFNLLTTTEETSEDPDYATDSGEVLDVVSEPQSGIISIQQDTSENVISEEVYQKLPTRYVIKRFGQVNKQVLLTFDDGPDAVYTPQILNILKRDSVPAAFFIVGINAEQNLPLLKRIVNEGFEIGNHSFTHPNMATVSIARAETEMEATRLLIESETGRSTILFRAPYNADAEPRKMVEVKPVARAKQDSYYTVGESIDPEDWDIASGVNADSIYNRVVRQYEANPEKGIILLHDAGGDRSQTVKALPRIIHYFKSRNIQFISISQLLGQPKDSIMPTVSNGWVKANGWVSHILYWGGKLLFAAFWIAILLGLGKILFLGVLALLQYVKSKKVVAGLSDKSHGMISIIVPAFNEEVNAVTTINNLLKQDYVDFEVVFVDDGSSDDTYEKVKNVFAGMNKVKVFSKQNGGKASALNMGISCATGDFVVCIDADTQLMPDAVRLMMKYFSNENVVAVAGNVKVGNEKNILTKWQSIEYTTAQNFDRRAFDLLNCITVVPGAIGAFRKSAIIAAGGFTTDTLAEDCDLTIRLQRRRGIVRNCTEAIAVTEAPETLKQFMKQRFRWSYGIMQSFWKNKDACFNPRFGTLGMIALPNLLLFQILMPIVAPIADLMFFISIAVSWNDPQSRQKLLLFYLIFLLVDVAVSLMAYVFEKEKIYKLIWLIPQRFAYRQLMYIILFRSLRKAIRGEAQGWGNLKRTGNVKLKVTVNDV